MIFAKKISEIIFEWYAQRLNGECKRMCARIIPLLRSENDFIVCFANELEMMFKACV